MSGVWDGKKNHVPIHGNWSMWLPTFPPDGQPHPNVDDMIYNGTGLNSAWVYPPNHPDLDVLCARGLPALWLYSHPNIDNAINQKRPMESFHPKVQPYLEAALPWGHPNCDDYLKSGESLPSWHPEVDIWMGRLTAYDYWITTPGVILAGHMVVLFLLAAFYRILTGKLFSCCRNKPNEEVFALAQSVPSKAYSSRYATENAAGPDLQSSLLQRDVLAQSQSRHTCVSVKSSDRVGSRQGSFRSSFRAAAGGADVKNKPSAAGTKAATEARKAVKPSPLDAQLHKSQNLHKSHVKDDLYDYGEYKNLPKPAISGSMTAANMEKILAADLPVQQSSFWTAFSCLCGYRVPNSQWTVGETFFVVFYIVLNFWCIWLSQPTGAPRGWPLYPSSWARAFGSLSAANMLFMLIPATRNSLLTWFLGLPFDHVILYHRVLGRWAIFTLTLHLALYFPGGFSWANLSPDEAFTYYTGIAAYVCGFLITVTSIEYVRREYFNVFYYAHWLFVPMLVLAFMHHVMAQIFIGLAIALYVLDRGLREMWAVGSHANELRLKGPELTVLRAVKNPLTEYLGMHKVGQYYFVNFPSISLTEWHPYSISSSPREIDVEFHIRDLGDHTHAVCALAAKAENSGGKEPLPWVRIDGPYGVHDFNFRSFPSIMMVGGGVGITPVIGMLKDIYNVGNFSKLESKKVIPHALKTVYAIWVIRHPSDYEWFREDLEKCASQAQLPQFPALQTWVYCSKAPANVAPPLIPGRPEFLQIFQDLDNQVNFDPVLTFACGPGAMVNEVWDLSVQRTSEGKRTDFHHETFDF